MAGNTRGKLKEHLEGTHRNFDWVIEHCAKSLNLIGDANPVLTEVITKLAEATQILDSLAQDIYAKL